MAWVRVFIIGIFLKIPVKLLAPIAVLFVDRQRHPVWGCRDATDLSYKNLAFRNGGHNFLTRWTPVYTTTGNTADETLEKLEGFQWRKRISLDKKYVSFRCTWGGPRASKGKREFYIGWVMNENETMRLTFFQLRPF